MNRSPPVFDLCGFPWEIKNISFSKNGPDEVNKLIDYLKIENINEELCCPSLDMSYFTDDGKKLDKTKLDEIKNISVDDAMRRTDDIKFIKCILEDHYAFLSVICDYIAGMTDNYAEDEYRQLYQT